MEEYVVFYRKLLNILGIDDISKEALLFIVNLLKDNVGTRFNDIK